jgi:hypothetical protein
MERVHVVDRLRVGSPFIGRKCPVCQKRLELGDQVLICPRHGIAITLNCWHEMAPDWQGICPYCARPVKLLPLLLPRPEPTIPAEAKRHALYWVVGVMVLALVLSTVLSILVNNQGFIIANLEGASSTVTLSFTSGIREAYAVKPVIATLASPSNQGCLTPTFYRPLLDNYPNLGCPVNAWESELAFQWFERGLVVWRKSSDLSEIYILYKRGEWRRQIEIEETSVDQLGLPMTGVMVAENTPLEQFQNGLAFKLGRSGYILFKDNHWESFLLVGDSIHLSPIR